MVGNRLSKIPPTSRGRSTTSEGEGGVCDHGHFDEDAHRLQGRDYHLVGRMASRGHSWPNRLEHQCQQSHRLGLVAKPLSGRGTFVDLIHESPRIEVARLVLLEVGGNENKDVSGHQWRLFFSASRV